MPLLCATLLAAPPLLPQVVDAQQIFADCPAGHVLDCAQDMFLHLTQQWLHRAISIAQRLFLALAALEMVVSGWVYWTRRGQQGDFVGTLAVKLGVLAFVLGVISSYSYWAPMIPYQLGMVATEIGGDETADLSVTGILQIGWRMAWAIFMPILAPLSAAAAGGGVVSGMIAGGVAALISGIGFAAPAAIAAAVATLALLAAMGAVIFICYAAIAIQLLTTLVEAYVVITSGFVFVGMAAFRGTAPFTTAYVQYVVYVGVKLFVLLLLCGAVVTAGGALTEILTDPAGGGHNLAFPQDQFTGAFAMVAAVATISFLFLELVNKVPDELANRISSSVSLDIQGLLGPTGSSPS